MKKKGKIKGYRERDKARKGRKGEERLKRR